MLIVPHSAKASKSFKVPVLLVKAISAVLLVSIALLGVFAYSYHEMVMETEELDELRIINTKQDEKIDELARMTDSLERELQNIAKTEKKIRELTELEELKDDIGDKLDFEDEDLDRFDGDDELWVGTGHPDDNYQSNDQAIAETKDTIRMLNMKMPEQQKSLETTKVSLEEKKEKLKHTPDNWPVEGRVSSPFGYRNSPITGTRQFHKGIDIAAPHRTPIKAAANGRVVYSSYRSGHGNLLILDHGYGYETQYAHLSSFEVEQGETIEKGDVIGYVGNTGSSTGPHLHFEIHVNGSPVDPKDILK